MSYGEIYIAAQTMDRCLEERRQQHASRRFRKQTSAARANYWRLAICEIGYRMVAVGAWLEQASMRKSPTLKRTTG